MTALQSDAATFAADMLNGFEAANSRYVKAVNGGVVRSTIIPDGNVGLVVGGGSGHYPAFAGLVGPGLAAGAVCGNIFASPSASQISRIARTVHRGAGVLLGYGNYAGDVLHFGLAQEQLRAAGMDVRSVAVTDDIASAPVEELHKRRGIAGDLTVFKVAGAAAEAGHSMDDVERIARRANHRTRSLGVAFSGCTLPGAAKPLFTVPAGMMAVGMGIHGEPGISEAPLPTPDELAELLVTALLKDTPENPGTRVAVLLNGLGTVKYDELFVLFGKVNARLRDHGLEVVQPECGELVTSLDMAGISLTLFWLDEELEALWAAPADSPAYRKGSISAEPDLGTYEELTLDAGSPVESEALVAAAPLGVRLFRAVDGLLTAAEEELGDLDAVAGDGDHGIGMARGAQAASRAAEVSASRGDGLAAVARSAGEAWAEEAGGTSGALWGAAICAASTSLLRNSELTQQTAVDAVDAGLLAMRTLGKAEPGDKTMIDAFVPFADTLRAGLKDGLALEHAWEQAAVAATVAATATADLRPSLGRARPLAEKSLGHPDAGATSLAMVVTTIGNSMMKEGTHGK
jgi:dihydroxyacetone kinase